MLTVLVFRASNISPAGLNRHRMSSQSETAASPSQREAVARRDSPGTTRLCWLWPVGVTIGVTVLMGITNRDYGLATDEPRYIDNADRMTAWADDFGKLGWRENLTAARLREGWYYARPDSKNLPFVSVVSVAGQAILGRFDTPPTSYRWGAILVFAVTCGVVFQWLRSEFSTASAVVAVAALLGTPRLFAHANLLSIDVLVGCFWVMASWALFRSRDRWSWSVLFAVLCGMGLTLKPTFWFAVPTWIVWCLCYRPREFRRAGLCLVTVAPLTALLLVPMWWPDPLGGLLQYVHMLRTDPIGWKIDAYYLGLIYQAEGYPPLPWHSVFLLPLITTPLWIMLLFLVGVGIWIPNRRTASVVSLWILGTVTLPLVCMLPQTPAHDGMRLYRTAFLFSAMIAGSGFEFIRKRWLARSELTVAKDKTATSETSSDRRRSYSISREWGTVLLVCLMSFWVCWRAHPAQLSYYNVLVGGLRGAAEPRDLGMFLPVGRRPLFEISYWWELLNRDALSEMQTHLPNGAKLWVFPDQRVTNLLQKWEHLRKDIRIVRLDRADYVLLYGRIGRLVDPKVRPIGSMFLEEKPIWEHRIDGVRVVALFRWVPVDTMFEFNGR